MKNKKSSFKPDEKKDIENAANYLMKALKAEAEKPERDEEIILYLISAAKLLPVFIPDLQKFM